jgi:hypothetical protein
MQLIQESVLTWKMNDNTYTTWTRVSWLWKWMVIGITLWARKTVTISSICWVQGIKITNKLMIGSLVSHMKHVATGVLVVCRNQKNKKDKKLLFFNNEKKKIRFIIYYFNHQKL